MGYSEKCPACGHEDVQSWAEDGESAEADFWECGRCHRSGSYKTHATTEAYVRSLFDADLVTDQTASHATGHEGWRMPSLDAWYCRACDDLRWYRPAATDGLVWAAIVTAAREDRDGQSPAASERIASGDVALLASAYARDLWRYPSHMGPRAASAWLESGLAVTVGRMARRHRERLSA